MQNPNWWDTFRPPAYDPNNPYAPDPGRRNQLRKGLPRRLAEQNPEAYFGRQMTMQGLPYNRGGDDNEFADFLRQQYQLAQQGYQQSRLGRPGLTWFKYANQDPTIQRLLAMGTPPPPVGRR